MPISTWLSGTFSHSQARRGKRPNPLATSLQRLHTFRPSLEGLEIRLALSLTTLASFAANNGAGPVGGVIVDSSGNLYGTTLGGGVYPSTVFELAQGSGKITTLASFNYTNGSLPEDAPIMDRNGNLYGTTRFGGAFGYGTVFELASGSGTITTLASFNDTNGANPYGGLIMDSSGNLYGTTSDGGYGNYGTVFELAHGSGTITTLASFNGTNGESPYDALIMDSSGNLYGTTSGGGPTWDPSGGLFGDGTVFELDHGSSTITTLASFVPRTDDGSYPLGGLIMDGSGNLYGTTSLGGVRGAGTVFELAHGSGTIITLASFNGANGAYPQAGLIMDASGNFYGTTERASVPKDGTVFELAHGSGTITTLASFNGANGAGPEDALIMDTSGNLYGTTFAGGASNVGTVFELSGADALPAVRISGLRSSTGAGASRAFTVTVPNAVGTTDTGYAGAVVFTSNASTANLITNDTAAGTGTNPFSGAVPQKKGKPSITDTLFSSIAGSLSADGS